MPEVIVKHFLLCVSRGILLLAVVFGFSITARALNIIDASDMKRGSLLQPYLLAFVLSGNAGGTLKSASGKDAVKLLKSGEADLVLVRDKYLPEFGAYGEKRYFGSRAAGVYLHNRNPRNNLSLKELEEIVSQNQPTWKKYTGDSAVIHRYSLTPRGVSESLPEEYFQLKERPVFVFFRNNKEILLLLKDDAVGFALGTLQFNDFPDEIKLISIDGIRPSGDNLHNGSYPVSIRYYLVWNADGKNSAQIDKFINLLQKQITGGKVPDDFLPAPWLSNGW